MTALDEGPQKASDLDPRLLVDEAGLKGYLIGFTRRLRAGELGTLPVIVGLVIIWGFFYSQQSVFLSAENISNLTLQMVGVGTISVGIVMVLLLGEVDLSAGSVAGVTAAILATQIDHDHRNQILAIVIALAVGAAIGTVQGLFFSKLGLPALIVTLAGLLGWAGLQLRVLGTTGHVTVTTGFVHDLTYDFLGHGAGYAFAAVSVALYAGAQGWESARRTKAGLRPRPIIEIVMRTAVIGAVLAVIVGVLNRYHGVPKAFVIFLVIVVIFDLVIRRTTYGRHVLAVGGNVEAARRAGVSVAFIRTSVFAISGMMAAAGGILFCSYQQSVDAQTGGNQDLLYAIAAAVIGGTSLFGGRGSAYSALLGILVIQSIANGMALLAYAPSTQFMVTGGVLLAAVTLDAVSRRGQASRGRV